MIRCALPLLLTVALGAAEDLDASRLMAAARAASSTYQAAQASLRDQLAHPDPARRIVALQQVALRADPDSAALLVPILQQGERTSAELVAACEAAEAVGNPAVTAPLVRPLLRHADPEVRLSAYNACERLGATTTADHLALAKDAIPEISGAGLTNLGMIPAAEAGPLLADGLSHHSEARIRRLCARALGQLGDRAFAPALRKALCDGDAQVRALAGEALARMGDREAIPELICALEANIAGASLNRSLVRLTGSDFGYDPQGDTLKRAAAIERAYAWWAANRAKPAGGKTK